MFRRRNYKLSCLQVHQLYSLNDIVLCQTQNAEPLFTFSSTLQTTENVYTHTHICVVFFCCCPRFTFNSQTGHSVMAPLSPEPIRSNKFPHQNACTPSSSRISLTWPVRMTKNKNPVHTHTLVKPQSRQQFPYGIPHILIRLNLEISKFKGTSTPGAFVCWNVGTKTKVNTIWCDILSWWMWWWRW